MPGRTPAAALDAYYKPLQDALACLPGVASIVRPPGIGKTGDEGMWLLNGAAGMNLGSGRVFSAQQAFALVLAEDQSAGKFRITTRMYSYRLTINGEDQWRMHWHPKVPEGSDRESRPPHPPAAQLQGAPSNASDDLGEGHRVVLRLWRLPQLQGLDRPPDSGRVPPP